MAKVGSPYSKIGIQHHWVLVVAQNYFQIDVWFAGPSEAYHDIAMSSSTSRAGTYNW
jgi:hypothetical protein